MLKIELDKPDSAYRPGTTLSGTVHWQMEKPPKEISAKLAWYTEGKGDEDGDVAIEQTWVPTSERGSQPIAWTVPRGPLSNNGVLIRVGWLIEVVSSKPDEADEVDIVIGHLGRPIASTPH